MAVLSARENLLALSRKKGGLFVNNFIPSTGIGSFDARYEMESNTLHIYLKVFYLWRNLQGPWSVGEQVEFKDQLRSVVENTWSECYTIASDKPEMRDIYASVKVHVQDVATEGAAHYKLSIGNFLAGETSGAMIGRPAGEKATGYFGRFDVQPEVKLKRDKGALNFKMQQAADMLTTSGAAYLPFPANSSKIPTDVSLKLHSFASKARRVITKEVAESEFAIYVYGKTGASDTAMNLMTGKNRANNVAKLLRSHLGFDNAVKVVSSASNENWILDSVGTIMRAQGFSAAEVTSRSFPGVMLLMKDPGQNGALLQTGIPRNYVIVAHEFGHMFGLPDEYFGVNCLGLEQQLDLRTVVPAAVRGLTRNRVDPREPGQAEGFAALLKESNVPAPVFMNTMSNVTTSIMYAGSDVLPAHYLTFWEALLNCTFPYFLPSEWKIVPNAKGEGKKSNLNFFAQ